MIDNWLHEQQQDALYPGKFARDKRNTGFLQIMENLREVSEEKNRERKGENNRS